MLSSEEQLELTNKFEETFDVTNDIWREPKSYREFKDELKFKAIKVMRSINKGGTLEKEHPKIHQSLTKAFTDAYDPEKNTILDHDAFNIFTVALTNNAPEVISNLPKQGLT